MGNPFSFPNLPIVASIPAIRAALSDRVNAVLHAPPGAGKTTVVPLALLDEPWLKGQKIVMLEPRRLATRAAARRMAQLLDEPLPATVGYRVRRDTRVSARTRIEVVTEGVLTRMLTADPTLDGVGAVIFDEFHERSIHADLGLALALQSQQLLRPELRLLVMSATLDVDPIAALLGNCPIVSATGRAFPVEVVHLAARADQRTEDQVAAAIRVAIDRSTGDLLAFLPGQGEIFRAQAQLSNLAHRSIDVYPLFGALSFEEQDRAIAASPPGRRKVVLATSVAESSLTIDGVTCVVDSGVARVPRFSPRTGMTRLATVRVSRASADQRLGRAGRLGPGIAFRLWSPEETAHLLAHPSPEIAEADLAPLALDLAVTGTQADELSFLTPPPRAALEQAQRLLVWLGAVDADRRITPHGTEMARIGAHPRIAHMLLRARELGVGSLGCDLAALLEERDLLTGGEPRARNIDLGLRIELLRAARNRGGQLVSSFDGQDVHRDALRRVLESAAQWRRELAVPSNKAYDSSHQLGLLVSLAYPDWIAKRRDSGSSRVLLRNGAGAVLRDVGTLAGAEYLAVAETDGRAPEANVTLAAALSVEELRRVFGSQIVSEESVEWDDRSGSVRTRRREQLGALLLAEADVAAKSGDAATVAVIKAVQQSALQLLHWSEDAVSLRARLAFLHAHDPSWPDVSDAALMAGTMSWLAPHLDGVRTRAQLERVRVGDALAALMDWRQRAALDQLAPTHYAAPTGSRLPIDYADPRAPVVRVRLQEMFGCATTPTVLGGRVSVTLHLLSPAHRPVQVTQDLASFWRTSYFDARKDLKGRYPKHYWPDNPLVAEPTRRAKPRPQ